MGTQINQPAPDFALPDLEGRLHRLRDYRGHIVVVDFWSAECPISRDYDAFFSEFAERFGPQGVVVLAVDSNTYEDEHVLHEAVRTRDLNFPVLRDEGNKVADLYGAETTPHVFVVDREGRLRYRGHVDDRSWQQKHPTMNYLEAVIQALLAGEEPPVQERPPFGCTINRGWDL
ncbi:MAG: redoxin domain-containing protein [Ardenticatenia bacterium]|nr:redoxin domain-containing protein [Ardenticatenia bacterium]